MCSAWKLLPLHVVCMRLSRRCPSLRRCFRLRCGFRTFIVSLAALYFAAMYLFQSGLDEPSARDREPARRWDAGGADDDFPRRRQERKEHRGQRLPVDLEGDRQAVFDGIRRLDQQRERGGRREEAADHVTGRRRPNPASDINVPASCNASASEQRRPRYDVFLPLAGLYLLSAFWDERPNDFDNWHNGTLVRVMAIIHDRPGATRLSCDFGGARRTAISFYEMCENHHRPYGSWILSCRVPDDVATQPSPCFVTVVAESSIAGDKVDVPVRTLRPPTAVPRSFSVCVPPLFGGVPPAKLVEFFELTFLLGADHIVVYDWNTSPKTQAVVQHYAARCRGGQRRCGVDVVPWRLPQPAIDRIWYNGQSLAIQDCLYRQMASSRYVVFSDVDEFLVPHGNLMTNWSQLAEILDRPSSCAFQFVSAFFDPAAGKQPPPHVKDDLSRRPPTGPELMTMRSTRRSKHFSNVRTKCMVQPYEIFEAGIHHISKPIWASLTVDRVETNVAFVHHYRDCVSMYGMNCAGTVDDPAVQRYFDALTQSTAQVWNELQLSGVL